MKNIWKFTLVFSLFCINVVQAEIKVKKVKGKKAVISFDESEDLKRGDKLRATDGKSDVLLIVAKVKGTNGIALVKGGTAIVGMTASKMSSSKKAEKSSEESSDSSPAPKKGKKGGFRYGILAGINLGSMSVKLTSGATSETAAMTGTSYSLKGTGEIPLGSSLFLRAGASYETLDVKGSITNTFCENSSSCVAQIPFLGADGIAGWYILNGGFKLNVFGGAGLLFPIGPSTNALDKASIKQSAVLKFGAGMAFGKKTIIPIELEYNMLPASADVQTSFIQIRGGITF